nr:tetratricopeptide repeat protein [Candidatus Sigynarchaeum springense]MDO8119295.1 tetratricopeptide repeat protein [Candidatus Sigynarchaeota archaeon]
MKFRVPGTRPPGDDAPASSSSEVDKIPAVQRQIDEIKRALREKTHLMGIWGTLADLYSLKATLKARACDPAVEQGDASPDALDKSMNDYTVGYKYYQMGSFGDAELYLVASINRLDWNVLARITLGNMFFVKGEYEKAKAAFEAALPYCEGEALSEVLTNLGMNAFKTGDVSNAEKYFILAIAVDPANAYAFNNLGLVSDARDDLNSAIAWHIKAVGAKPSDEELWYNLGNVLGKAGKKAERLFCFMKAEERGFSELKELVEDLMAQGIKPIDPRSSQSVLGS